MIRPIVLWGAEVLEKPSDAVTNITDAEIKLVRDMTLGLLMALLMIAGGLRPAAGAENPAVSPGREKKEGVNLGRLTCKTEPGTRTQRFLRSSVALDCVFKTDKGEEKYKGEIGFLGVDLGKREERTLYFRVFGYATDARLGSYPLQGDYLGTSIGAGAYGQGYGSSALVGGIQKSFNIVPSVETFKGAGITAGGTKMHLEPAKDAQMKGELKK